LTSVLLLYFTCALWVLEYIGNILSFRLYESHKRVQKVNQNLEDKLLKIVDKCETEKNSLTRDVASLTQKLVEARGKIHRLQDENVCGFAVVCAQMLHSWNKTDIRFACFTGTVPK